jgi:hypothetical protein
VADALAAFLLATPAAAWRREPLAGDASVRRYERLRGPGGASAVLMDARAEPASLAPFLRIGRHLRGLGLAAPAVLAADEGAGLLLLEDLGPSTMADWLDLRPEDAPLLHEVAVEVLARLARAAPPDGLAAFTPQRMAGLVAPFFEHHAPGLDPRLASELTGRLCEALDRHAPSPTALSLRDFHAENLVWRDGREGTDRLGLLDFQDAVAAPPEYDLASLLRDARRDGDDALRRATIRRFAERTGREAARVEAAAAVLGVQRNLRILGIFARLAGAGRTGYLRHVPRLLRHLGADLAHPALDRVRPLAAAALQPAPAEARP